MGAAPADFLDEVELAGVRAASGDLALLTEELRLFGPEWAAAGLRAIREARLRIEVGDRAPEPARVLAFTGHRIDAPDRAVPRFPATAEPQARSMIHESIVPKASWPASARDLAPSIWSSIQRILVPEK